VTVDSAVIQRATSTRRHGRTTALSGAPVRTCIGCRQRGLAVELLRLKAVDDGNGQRAVTVDSTGRLPGRGAWLHPDPDCLESAVRRRAFGRALRIAGSPDITAVVERLRTLGHPDNQETGSEEHEHTVKSR
jgi:uncharacterized protein